MIKRIVTVSPRGFCAGVTRSIKVVEDALEIFGAPVYIKHAIVHNKTVINDLKKKGAIIVDEVKEIPEGAVAVFSAHGSPPEHFEEAKKRNIYVIDATCPLVTKVHFEMISTLKNKQQPIYIGHQGHVEAEGVVGEAKKFQVEVPIVETVEDVENLNLKIKPKQEVVVLTQTTFNVNKIKTVIGIIKKKFSNVIEPAEKDICYATTNRQEAIAELAKKVDLILVIGSKESSNSNRLVEVAKENGTEAKLLDTVVEIKPEWLIDKKVVGLSAGASAPEYRVQEIVDYFVAKGARQESLAVVEEHMKFSEPVELKKVRKNKKENYSTIKIAINKNKEKWVDDKLIQVIARNTFRKLQETNKVQKELSIEISIALVDKNKMAELNQQYRQKNGPTDVLSFCYEKNKKKLEGEIIICPTIIKKNAAEDKIEFEEELSRNIIHGILHIVGYEHGGEMFNLQNNILNNK
jgi:4-hydroxy-3-methylbut-2-enyl diphosphate reductase